MIRLDIKEIATRAGFENPYALSIAAGLPYETCRKLWQQSLVRIDLRTLEKLCDALEVRPGLLFEYHKEKSSGPKAKRRRLRKNTR